MFSLLYGRGADFCSFLLKKLLFFNETHTHIQKLIKNECMKL